MKFRVIYNNTTQSHTCDNLQLAIDTAMTGCYVGAVKQALIFVQRDNGQFASAGVVFGRRSSCSDSHRILAFLPSDAFKYEHAYCLTLDNPSPAMCHSVDHMFIKTPR